MDNNEENIQNENLNEEDNIVILTDEDGNDVKFQFLDLIEYNDDNFVVLLPAEEDDEDDNEVVILKEDKDAEEESYVSVDDEETLEKIFGIFKDKFKDEFIFEDDDQ